MANVFTFYFKGSDLKDLIGLNPDYLLVSAEIVASSVGGVDVGVIVVKADAFKTGLPSIGSRSGCPVPPCIPRFAQADQICIDQAEKLRKSYIDNNIK